MSREIKREKTAIQGSQGPTLRQGSHAATGSSGRQMAMAGVEPPAAGGPRTQNFKVWCPGFPTLFPDGELQSQIVITPEATIDDIKGLCSGFIWEVHGFDLRHWRFALTLLSVDHPTPWNCPLWFLPEDETWHFDLWPHGWDNDLCQRLGDLLHRASD